MTDISGVPAFGGGGVALRPFSGPERPLIREISSAAQGGSATHARNGDTTPERPAAGRADIAPAPPGPDKRDAARDVFDPDMLVGPSPAFDASLLEVERDLRTVIARIEAARTNRSDGPAIAPAGGATPGEGPEPNAQATQTPTSQAPSTPPYDREAFGQTGARITPPL